jgi:hypothetical protein
MVMDRSCSRWPRQHTVPRELATLFHVKAGSRIFVQKLRDLMQLVLLARQSDLVFKRMKKGGKDALWTFQFNSLKKRTIPMCSSLLTGKINMFVAT